MATGDIMTYERKILNIRNVVNKMNDEVNSMNHIDRDLKTKIQSKFRKINEIATTSLMIDDFSNLQIIVTKLKMIIDMIFEVLEDLDKAKVNFLDDFNNKLLNELRKN